MAGGPTYTGVSMQKKVDAFDRRIIARPRSIKSAREKGGMLLLALTESMKHLGKIPPEDWDEGALSQKELEKTGAILGEGLYKRGGSWTVNRFLKPVLVERETA
jgi:hypothetical protein